MTETCSNCRFGHAMPWSTETASGVNTFCREQPPEFIPPGSTTLKPVQADGWCGKWFTKTADWRDDLTGFAGAAHRFHKQFVKEQEGALATVSVPAPGSDPKHVPFPELSPHDNRTWLLPPKGYGDWYK